MKKIRVGILCGGKSAEHEVSLLSAKNVTNTLDKEKYDIIVIGIDQKGNWFLHDSQKLSSSQPKPLQHSGRHLSYALDNSKELVAFSATDAQVPLDVIFPVLHGPYGEDGTVQGFLKLAGVPFVGASVLGSAIGMDKDVMKRLLKEAGIRVAKFLVYRDFEKNNIQFEEVKKQLGLPFFVKPANLGSSVGITKVKDKESFKNALNDAFLYDTKVLIEEAVSGREIECSVLGNDKKIASLPGEIIPHADFYSYDAKYLDPEGAEFVIPAKLNEKITEEIQQTAIHTANVLCVDGMARVDFFLTRENRLYVNEINTIPGFTAISMYPKMWEASGISYSELADRLIQLALERFAKEQKLKTVK